MRREALYALALTLALAGGAWAQTGPMAPAEGANAVTGLALPADLTVGAEGGFVEIEAVCTGEVRFTVLGSQPVNFKALPKSVIVGTPARGGSIVVVAVGLVGGNLTEFARCTVTVTPVTPPAPGPVPGPGPTPPPTGVVAGKWFVTLVFDPSTQTPAQAALINSAALRQLIQANGSLRVVDRLDQWLAAKKLDTEGVAKAGGFPCILVQNEQGTVVLARPLPATEAEALALVKQIRGQP